MKNINLILFGQKSLLYATLYFLVIPTYAIIYSNMQNQFFKSTYKIEKLSNITPTSSPIEQSVTNKLIDIITNNFIEKYNCNYLVNNNQDTIFNPIRRSDYAKYNIELSDEYITIPISIYKDNANSYVIPLRFEIKKYPFPTDFRSLEVDTLSYYFAKEVLDSNRLGYDYHKLFDPFPLKGEEEMGNSLNNKEMSIQIDNELQRQINTLAFGLNSKGNPDDFWNLFYFSAVTITTLGYGDIVPITSNARIWVSSEAIIGVVLIGLFLNSLALKSRKHDN